MANNQGRLLTLLRIKEQLNRIEKGVHSMSVDVSKLTADVSALATRVESLVTAFVSTRDTLKTVQGQLASVSTADPAVQGAVDAAVQTLEAESAKIDAALSPQPLPAAGATGA